MKKKQKRKLNTNNLIILLLAIVLVVAAFASIIQSFSTKHEDPKTSVAPIANATPTPTSSPTPTTTPTSTPEPTEDPTFTDTNSLLLIANKKHKLPDGYEPSDLTPITDIPKQDRNEYMRQEAAEAVTRMFKDAEGQGIYLFFISGYRSQAYQTTLFQSYVDQGGQAFADSISSRPGYSDHQTGLACDIGQTDGAGLLSQDFINTPAGQWLYENAHNYGFILRYPNGKDAITGYSYEPWHYRYVGVDIATKLYNISPDETLEEYYNIAGGDYDN